jgi:prepilin-type processing-associated H-X9-DG protein/prepilin-type N-terminal cleavage/methylation domain-containing protein
MKIPRPGVQSALTLIELMVVIAVIGILAALLLAAVSQAKGRAQRIQCVGNLHQLGVGLQVFLSNNHGYPAAFQNTNDDYPGYWALQLERGGLGIASPQTNFYQKGIWLCPSAQWHYHNVSADELNFYGYNAFGVLPVGNLTNSPGLLGHHAWSSSEFTPIADSEVSVPSDMIAIGDGNGSMFFMRGNLAVREKTENILTRHQGKANVVFCDGHVESPTLQFLFTDTSDAALSRWNRDHQPHRELLAP